MKLVLYYLNHEFKCCIQNTTSIWNTTLYYITIVLLYAMVLQHTEDVLPTIKYCVVLVSYFIVVTSLLENIFFSDKAEGYALEYHFSRRLSLFIMIFCKLAIKWLIIACSIIVSFFSAYLILSLDIRVYMYAVIIMLFVLPILIFIGCIGSALLMGYKEKSLLLPLFTTPLYLPILLFIANILDSMIKGAIDMHSVYILSSIWLFFMLFAPIVSIYALKLWNE